MAKTGNQVGINGHPKNQAIKRKTMSLIYYPSTVRDQMIQPAQLLAAPCVANSTEGGLSVSWRVWNAKEIEDAVVLPTVWAA